jgi:radical SAM protein with 4Fe4S-binding SPASM domain
MSADLWSRILSECSANRLNAILMDHEAESMMNPRFFHMLKEATDHGILDTWLHTNATLLTRERSERLIDCGLKKINFSLDAVTEDVYRVLRVGGHYGQVVANVKEFLKLKRQKGADYLRARVSFAVQKENAHQREAFFDFWKQEEGLNLIAFQECVDYGPFERPDGEERLSAANLEAKYASEEPFHCSLPWEMPVIDVDGNVLPCGSPVRAHNAAFILGNINRGNTIASCWNGDKITQLRELHTRGEWYKNPMCRVCVKTMRKSHVQQLQWHGTALNV